MSGSLLGARARVAGTTLLLGLVGTANAQQPSDLMPAPAPTPPGARAWVPGVPPPDLPTTSAAEGTSTAPALSGAGRGSALLRSETLTSAPASPPPRSVVIESGDTLWEIAARYFGSPSVWPKLWSYNPAVSNPHWLFPGDTLRLAPPGDAPPPAPKAAPPLLDQPAPQPRAIVLRQNGFLDEGELTKAATVIGSREEREMLATFDEAYLETKREQPLVVGQRYLIYRPLAKVKHPVSRKSVGSFVEVVGEVKVEEVTSGGIARATILEATNPIERGYRVGPLKQRFHSGEVVPSKVDLEGVIVTSLPAAELLGSDMLVFVDRGRGDGVEVGNCFDVVRRGDGNQRGLKHAPTDNPKYPREVMGRVLVLDVYAHAAAGMLLDAKREVRVGDRVELRRPN